MYTVLCWMQLFRMLLEKNISPVYFRLLLNMYVSQNHRIIWESTHSSYFNVSNGVKQGGVISSILFCIHIDGLLEELEQSGVGFSWGMYILGHLAKLVTSTVQALHILTIICIQYAANYDILFNG